MRRNGAFLRARAGSKPLTVPAWHLDCARRQHGFSRRQAGGTVGRSDPPNIGRRSRPAPNLEQGKFGREAMTALIEAKELRKSFGELKAVDGISLTVPRGEVLGFLGPNGAGKSTTMKMLTGFLEPDAGTARIAGYDVQEQPILAKAKLGYLPEGAPLYAEMTPRKLLQFVA